MSSGYAVSYDGIRIAYDVNGTGPPILLLHGGLQSRQIWHDAGYVDRLKNDYKVIAVDIRGNGESDKPLAVSDYAIEKHCQDVLAVADACGIERFALWGYSLGGNIGRYLAAQSPRVASFIMIGISFGLGASGDFRKLTMDFRDHWLPILQAQREGTLNIASLSAQDREQLSNRNMPLIFAQAISILEWGRIEPGDIRCPTLLLAGSDNDAAMAGIAEYGALLEGSSVQVKVVEGLDHIQELTSIDKVLPLMLEFIKVHPPGHNPDQH